MRFLLGGEGDLVWFWQGRGTKNFERTGKTREHVIGCINEGVLSEGLIVFEVSVSDVCKLCDTGSISS